MHLFPLSGLLIHQMMLIRLLTTSFEEYINEEWYSWKRVREDMKCSLIPRTYGKGIQLNPYLRTLILISKCIDSS